MARVLVAPVPTRDRKVRIASHRGPSRIARVWGCCHDAAPACRDSRQRAEHGGGCQMKIAEKHSALSTSGESRVLRVLVPHNKVSHRQADQDREPEDSRCGGDAQHGVGRPQVHEEPCHEQRLRRGDHEIDRRIQRAERHERAAERGQQERDQRDPDCDCAKRPRRTSPVCRHDPCHAASDV